MRHLNARQQFGNGSGGYCQLRVFEETLDQTRDFDLHWFKDIILDTPNSERSPSNTKYTAGARAFGSGHLSERLWACASRLSLANGSSRWWLKKDAFKIHRGLCNVSEMGKNSI